jgi:hypothetical protein
MVRHLWYYRLMTKLLEQALRQVELLSASYLAHRDDVRLSDAQLAEIRRRPADLDRKLVSHDEARERLGRLAG